MLRFLADEDFDEDIIRGILRHTPEVDILTVQEAGMRSAPDAEVLQAAASMGRILLTHDARTTMPTAILRVAAGDATPGVFIIRQRTPKRRAIEEVLIVAECSYEGEWEGQVRYLPL